MSRPRFRELRYWLGIAITLLSVVFLLRGVDFARVADALGSVDYLRAAIALLTVVLTILLKALRWKTLFQPPSAQPSAYHAVAILTIGQMINSVFPLRLGEVGRIYLTSEIEGSPPSLTTATIVMEKTVDSLFLLLCIALVVPFVPLPAWLGPPIFAVALGVAVVVILAIALAPMRCSGGDVSGLAHWRRWMRFSLGAVLRFLPNRWGDYLGRSADVVLESVSAVQRPRVLAQVALLSVAIWILAALTNYVAFLSLGMRPSLVAAVFLLVVLQIGVAVPSAPGRLGVFQAITVLGLSLFSVDQSVALIYGIFLHVVVFLPPSAAGIVLLWRENGIIRQKRGRMSTPEAPVPGGSA